MGRHSTHNRHGSAAAASFKQRRRQSIKEKRRSGEHESSSDADNLLAIACESESTECVIILLDEIMNARRSCLLSTKSPVFTSSTPNSTVNGSEGFDVREFLELPEPRQVVFFELGSDLAASNRAVTVKQMEMSIYGLMLTKTPKAFMHLLDSCVYTVGKKTYVDFFPFYNPDGSELSILKGNY